MHFFSLIRIHLQEFFNSSFHTIKLTYKFKKYRRGLSQLRSNILEIPYRIKILQPIRLLCTMLMMHLEILLFIISFDNPGISTSALWLAILEM